VKAGHILGEAASNGVSKHQKETRRKRQGAPGWCHCRALSPQLVIQQLLCEQPGRSALGSASSSSSCSASLAGSFCKKMAFQSA
jgi:hypothetical protein